MKTSKSFDSARFWLMALSLAAASVLLNVRIARAFQEEEQPLLATDQVLGEQNEQSQVDQKQQSNQTEISNPVPADAASVDGTPAVNSAQTATTDSAAPEYLVPAGAAAEDAETAQTDDFDSDPWEPFNEKMFWFNREVLDRFLLKPLATAWDFLLPDQVQRGIHNMFDNLAVVRRVVNNTLQAKFMGAATELARFTINSTIGVVGFFDIAKDGFGIEQRDEDAGQTFGVWGMGPGPYLVLPFLPPLTVRDGIGYALDAAMTPYVYFIPWYASLGGTVTNAVNERSINLDRFERVAESTVDLYSAVRNAFLQRRAAAIRQ